MTKLAGILKATMEITGSFIGILGSKKKKNVHKHRHIRRILATSQNHREAWRVKPRKWRTSKEGGTWLKFRHRNSLNTTPGTPGFPSTAATSTRALPALPPSFRREQLTHWAQIAFHKDEQLNEDLTPPCWLPQWKSMPSLPITLEFLRIKMLQFWTIKNEKWPLWALKIFKYNEYIWNMLKTKTLPSKSVLKTILSS